MKLNKDVIKGILIGVVFTIILSGTTVIASNVSYSKNLSAVFSNIKVIVDGKQVDLNDGNGKKLEPFMVDGTTYLPVRGISQVLGLNVGWDGNANTIYIVNPKTTVGNINNNVGIIIGKDNEGNKQGIVNITELTPKRGNYLINKNSSVVMFGDTYNFETGFVDNFDVVYDLFEQYQKITGLFGISDHILNNDSESGTLYIYGDGRLLETITVSRKEPPKKVDVDIKNIKELRIESRGNWYSLKTNFLDVQLHK